MAVERKKRLTDRQTAVLAAVERLGRPSMIDLRPEFLTLPPSAVKSVLDSLEKKGLVEHAGDPDQVYLGGVRWWSTAITPTSRSERLEMIESVVSETAPDFERSVDDAEGALTLYLPLEELERFLAGEASLAMQQIRGCVWRLERDGQPVEISLDTRMVASPPVRLAVKLR